MARFDPPDSHWAADFDERLTSTFHWLKDQLEELQRRVGELESKDGARDDSLAQAVRDMKFYVEGK